MGQWFLYEHFVDIETKTYSIYEIYPLSPDSILSDGI